jgi:hypothetical protein
MSGEFEPPERVQGVCIMAKTQTVAEAIMADIMKAVANTKAGPDGYKGFHSVFSGFWTYERSKHNLTGDELSDILKALTKEGKIAQRGVKGGYLIFLAADASQDSGKRFEKLLV